MDDGKISVKNVLEVSVSAYVVVSVLFCDVWKATVVVSVLPSAVMSI